MKDHSKADSIVIKWIGGDVQTLYDIPANQMIVIEESVNLKQGQKYKTLLLFAFIAVCLILAGWLKNKIKHKVQN